MRTQGAGRRPRRIGILSDDLTGAGDIGLYFRRAGFRTEIVIARKDGSLGRHRPSPGVRVWIIDTETRHCSPRDAALAVGKATERLVRWGADFFYKKIDSTLRGPVRDELISWTSVLGRHRRWGGLPIVFAPAYPRMKRTTRRGVHYVGDRPLHRSAFGKDVRCPVSTSSLAEILQADGEETGTPGNISVRVGRSLRLLIPDISSQNELKYLSREIRRGRFSAPGLVIGSAGLAEELARSWGVPSQSQSLFHPGPGRQASPVMVVAGSANPRTHRQLAVLEREEDVLVVRTPVLLKADRAPRMLARLVREARRKAGPSVRRYVLTGGETASAFLRILGIWHWEIQGEVESGVALCSSVGSPGPKVWMVLKPGGFGQDRVLIKSVRRLRHVV
ncbi:MAG TPA: four-carbon acid sugar kinase family protein [Elusimicrobiota bacterium]|nr:four-carbon acid sugar kinase family protein [Elusimicrobiota bacterium]